MTVVVTTVVGATVVAGTADVVGTTVVADSGGGRDGALGMFAGEQPTAAATSAARASTVTAITAASPRPGHVRRPPPTGSGSCGCPLRGWQRPAPARLVGPVR